MTSITPIPVPPTSAVNVQKINEAQAMPSQVQRDAGSVALNSPEGRAQINSNFTMEIDPQSTPEQRAAMLKTVTDMYDRREEYTNDLLSQTQLVLDEVASENPSLLNKKFDFTNTGDEIDVINHNLSDQEYSYLKAKLNANDQLVKATDGLNNEVAAYKRSTSTTNIDYQKEDIAGRIHVMSLIDKAQEITQEVKAGEEKYGYFDNDEKNIWEIASQTRASISTRA